MNLASLIREARERASLSQSQAAKEWGIPLPTIQAWEQGRNTPGGKHLAKLLPIIQPATTQARTKRTRS